MRGHFLENESAEQNISSGYDKLISLLGRKEAHAEHFGYPAGGVRTELIWDVTPVGSYPDKAGIEQRISRLFGVSLFVKETAVPLTGEEMMRFLNLLFEKEEKPLYIIIDKAFLEEDEETFPGGMKIKDLRSITGVRVRVKKSPDALISMLSRISTRRGRR